MQTFLPYKDPTRVAKCLDRQRLGKQRVEAAQIADACLYGSGWQNHPIVKMWKGYEPYLIKVYLRAMLKEWADRGYANTKCLKHYKRLSNAVLGLSVRCPKWFTRELIRSHRSNLLRKNKEYYSQYFKDIPSDIKYVWYNKHQLLHLENMEEKNE